MSRLRRWRRRRGEGAPNVSVVVLIVAAVAIVVVVAAEAIIVVVAAAGDALVVALVDVLVLPNVLFPVGFLFIVVVEHTGSARSRAAL
jgi:hypothetical protein